MYYRFLIFSFFLLTFSQVRAEEGMYPINMLDKIPLNAAGLKINPSEIYNPNGTGLIQAVVRLNGCTGSFVSADGLIITNHHCAFGGLEPFSSPENNLMEKGFLAANHEQELQLKNFTVKIMDSHEDISAIAMKGTDTITDAIRKKEMIAKNLLKVRTGELLRHPDMSIETSEMLPNKIYMLFRYVILKDIRIVFIPARNIGEFGGESDNWVWPRHNADFSFVRAYVGKDGKPAEYSTDNVPFQPKEYLNISSQGVKEGDFVFIVGYPGRTYRHQPAEFLRFHEEFHLPYIANLYEWEINTIKLFGKTDSVFMLKNEPKIKSLANVMKNYQGKIKSVRRIELYEKKKKEESTILTALGKDMNKRNQFLTLLNKVDTLYAKTESNYFKFLWYSNLVKESRAISIAKNISQFTEQYQKEEDVDKQDKLLKNYTRLLRDDYLGMYKIYDSTFVRKMMTDAAHFDNENKVPAVESLLGATRKKINFSFWTHNAYTKSKLLDSAYVFSTMNRNPKKFLKMKEPILEFYNAMRRDFSTVDSLQTVYKARLDNLLPQYVDLSMEAQGNQFIPDANSTLRLTYGHIKGYAPSDATYYEPFTTLKGMVEKNGESEDFKLNYLIADRIAKAAYGEYKMKDKDDLPLCMLYNTDTTGGNSGSPVLNSEGQLIAVNFDRAFEATVNDYAWSDTYSRSIGVDIRFVLWVLSNVVPGQHLMKEIFVEKK